MGLREDKKQRTRARLTEQAWRLAAERSFDQVTVAEIATAADVSEATVFNYFRTKEDVFYEPLDAFGDRLVTAVADRTPGVSPLSAVHAFLLDQRGLLEPGQSDPASRKRLRAQTQVITESAALLAREQRALATTTSALAAQLTTEGDDPVIAAVVAHALIGVHQSLIQFVRDQVLLRPGPSDLADRMRAHLDRAVSLLASGLDHYRDPT